MPDNTPACHPVRSAHHVTLSGGALRAPQSKGEGAPQSREGRRAKRDPGSADSTATSYADTARGVFGDADAFVARERADWELDVAEPKRQMQRARAIMKKVRKALRKLAESHAVAVDDSVLLERAKAPRSEFICARQLLDAIDEANEALDASDRATLEAETMRDVGAKARERILSTRAKLKGLTIRQLIDEGRRY